MFLFVNKTKFLQVKDIDPSEQKLKHFVAGKLIYFWEKRLIL